MSGMTLRQVIAARMTKPFTPGDIRDAILAAEPLMRPSAAEGLARHAIATARQRGEISRRRTEGSMVWYPESGRAA